MSDDTELVTITKSGHDDDVVPAWALPARRADGWKVPSKPASTSSKE